MKFTIAGVQQKVLIEKGYSVTDAVILNYLRGILTSKSKKIKRVVDKEGKLYCFIHNDIAVKNLPTLKINANTFQKYLKKYADTKILLRVPRRIYYHGSGKFFYHTVYFYRFEKSEYFHLFSRVDAP